MKKVIAILTAVLMFTQFFAVSSFADVDEELIGKFKSLIDEEKEAEDDFLAIVDSDGTKGMENDPEWQEKLSDSVQNIQDLITEYVELYRDMELEAIDSLFSDEDGKTSYFVFSTYYDYKKRSDDFFADLLDNINEIGEANQKSIKSYFETDGTMDVSEKFVLMITVGSMASLKDKVTDSPLSLLSKEKTYDIEVYENKFPHPEWLVSSLYDSVKELVESLNWDVKQNNDPEIDFDTEKQTLKNAHIYLDYYADCTKEGAKEAVEEYSDTLVDAIQYAFPNIQIDKLSLYWRIPSIDKNSLYGAMMFYENKNGTIARDNELGLIY